MSREDWSTPPPPPGLLPPILPPAFVPPPSPAVNASLILARLDALEDVLRLGLDSIRKIRQEIRNPALTHTGLSGPLIPVGQLRSEIDGPLGSSAGSADPDPAWLPIRHSMTRPDESGRAPEPCGGIALYLTTPPQENVRASLEVMRVRLPYTHQWKIPELGLDEPRCSTCWALVDPFSSSDLDYLSHMRPAGPLGAYDRRGSGADLAPSETGGISPDPSGLLSGLPPTLAGHTPDASDDVLRDIEHLQALARAAQLLPGLPPTAGQGQE